MITTGLGSKQTIAGFHEFAKGRQHPHRLTRLQYSSLADEERQRYDQQRRSFHAQLATVGYDYTEDVQRHVDRLLELNANRDVGKKTHLAIDGPPGVGKTTAAEVAAARVHRRLVEVRGSTIQFPGGQADHVPVVFVSARFVHGTKGFFESLLSFYDPLCSGNTDALAKRFLNYVERSRTQLIVVDDASALRRSAKGSRAVTDDMKSFINLVPATVVFVGAGMEGSVFYPDPARRDNDPSLQLAHRIEYMRFEPFERPQGKGRSRFAAFLSVLERGLYLLDHEIGTLSAPRMAGMIHDQTGGVTSQVVHWIEAAAVQAVGTRERVDAELLAATSFPGAR